MKKIAAIILILFLAACGNEYSLHDDFEKDLNQILDMLDEAYEANRELTDDEYELNQKFIKKYEHGQFNVDEEPYEMNDLEKAITNQVRGLYLFTESEQTLESEQSFYEENRNKIDEYITEKDIPDELKGTFPTYEIRYAMDIHPQLKDDAMELIDTFEGIVNGNDTDIGNNHVVVLDDFIKEYGTREFEIDDKQYLITEDEGAIVFMAEYLQEDIDNEVISSLTVTRFNNVKDLIKKQGN